MARLERTPMRYHVRPQPQRRQSKGHSDKEWCGYISVRVIKPTDMLLLICLKIHPLSGRLGASAASLSPHSISFRQPVDEGHIPVSERRRVQRDGVLLLVVEAARVFFSSLFDVGEANLSVQYVKHH